jgi:hypothetical protein
VKCQYLFDPPLWTARWPPTTRITRAAFPVPGAPLPILSPPAMPSPAMTRAMSCSALAVLALAALLACAAGAQAKSSGCGCDKGAGPEFAPRRRRTRPDRRAPVPTALGPSHSPCRRRPRPAPPDGKAIAQFIGRLPNIKKFFLKAAKAHPPPKGAGRSLLAAPGAGAPEAAGAALDGPGRELQQASDVQVSVVGMVITITVLVACDLDKLICSASERVAACRPPPPTAARRGARSPTPASPPAPPPASRRARLGHVLVLGMSRRRRSPPSTTPPRRARDPQPCRLPAPRPAPPPYPCARLPTV